MNFLIYQSEKRIRYHFLEFQESVRRRKLLETDLKAGINAIESASFEMHSPIFLGTKQFLNIGEHHSGFCDMISGITQRLVLGLLIFFYK